MTGALGPTVSVLIPTRNRAEVLPRALASVLAQTFTDFEIVVVDDGSTDGTAALRDSVTDPRVVWIEGQQTGVSAARNFAAYLARGEWLAFLDDDNEWSPDYLARQMDAAARVGVDVVSCLGTEEGLDGARWAQDPPPSPDPVLAFARGWSPFTSCVLVRRTSFLRAGGFPPHLSHSEDRYLWIRLAFDGWWVFTPDVLMARHRPPGGRLSDDYVATRKADAEIERTYGQAVQRRAGIRAAMRFFWIYRGRDECRRMLARMDDDGRRAGWEALSTLARALPRSASSMGRPLVVAVAGPVGYARFHSLYHHVHHTLAARR